MNDPARLLAAYDDPLRTDAETASAVSVTRHGPVLLVSFAGGRVFITYRDLGGVDASTIVDRDGLAPQRGVGLSLLMK